MLIEAVRDVARAAPERAALVADAGTSSYAELADRSAALATGLAQRGLTRFGVAVSDRSDAIALLAASSLLGAEACVYPAAIEADERDQLASRLEHPAVITDAELPQLAGTPFEGAAPADGSVMILTTGTTGPPKGARHEWARLIAAVAPRRADPAPAGCSPTTSTSSPASRCCSTCSPAARRWSSADRASRATRSTAMRDRGSPTPAPRRPSGGCSSAASTRRAAARASARADHARRRGGARRRCSTARRALPRAPASPRSTPHRVRQRVSVRDGRSGLPLSVLDRGDDADVQLRIVDGELQMPVARRACSATTATTTPATGGGRPATSSRCATTASSSSAARPRSSTSAASRSTRCRSRRSSRPSRASSWPRAYGRPNPITGQIVAVDVVARRVADTERSRTPSARRARRFRAAARPRRIRFVDELEVRENKIVAAQDGGSRRRLIAQRS